MGNENEDRHDVPALIGQLSQAAVGLDKDDLATLAKMHGWCEVLAEVTGPNAAPAAADPIVYETATSLSHTLEALILGEAEDPDQVVAAFIEAVSTLSGSAPAPSLGPEPADAKTGKGDSEVAAKLAKVFDDDVEPAAETAAPADQTEPAPHKTEEPVASAGAEAPAQPPYEQEPLVIGEKETEFVKGFVEEAREHLESIETAVLEVERLPGDSAKIDDLFRPFHTIKGMAGFLNLRDVNCLAHKVETLLDQGRKGQRAITPDLIDLILEAVDIHKLQIDSIATYLAQPEGDTVAQPPVTGIIDKLRAVAAGRYQPEVHQPGPGRADQKVGENLVEQGAVSTEVVESAVVVQASRPDDGKKIGELLVDTGIVTPKQVSKAIRPQAQGTAGGAAAPGGRSAAGDQSVRIETAKLDALVDMVGELVIAQTLVAANPRIVEDQRLSKDVGQVAKIVRDVQEVAMSMRMVPIGPTFQRMARLVRDVSRKAGKKVELTISGEDTELDKNVIQQIGDPLVHMVRNAVDHGIELPEDRIAAGKDEVGHVHLSAAHQGGNIVIQIQDDGKGLDREKLIAKGIEKGLVQPGEELTDEQAYALVFAPGFSTAAQVTDISGRGVGMDVVRRNLEQLRGRTEITSEKGRGSTFSICLPLTLAIIDGMVVQVGRERCIFPTITIEQALRPLPEQITTVQQRGEVLKVRGRLIPLIQLGELFGLCGRIDPCKAMVVIAHADGRQIGVVVERLIGQQQVVVKTLGERFEGLRGVSGAAILGDGRVGLILETLGLAAAHADWHPQTPLSETDSSAARGNEANDGQTDEAPSAPTYYAAEEAVSEPAECEPLAVAATV